MRKFVKSHGQNVFVDRSGRKRVKVEVMSTRAVLILTVLSFCSLMSQIFFLCFLIQSDQEKKLPIWKISWKIFCHLEQCRFVVSIMNPPVELEYFFLIVWYQEQKSFGPSKNKFFFENWDSPNEHNGQLETPKKKRFINENNGCYSQNS